MSDICKLTGLPTTYEKGRDTISYDIDLGTLGNRTIKLCSHCANKIPTMGGTMPTADIRRVMIGEICNGRFDPDHYRKIHWKDENVKSGEIGLDKFLEQSIYPKSTKSRRNHFLRFLAGKQNSDCETIYMDLKLPEVWGANYYVSLQECAATFAHFVNVGWIMSKPIDSLTNLSYQFTHEGLDELDRLSLEENQSNYGFVAMSFADGTEDIRSAIKQAIINAGFEPDIADEGITRSDQTIPDKIFASIRRARFCIADFTNNSNGVYFEAGFALGLGIPVFYTCDKKDFNEKAHFDIKQLQQILYETPAELEKELEAKIKAWIR